MHVHAIVFSMSSIFSLLCLLLPGVFDHFSRPLPSPSPSPIYVRDCVRTYLLYGTACIAIGVKNVDSWSAVNVLDFQHLDF